MPNGLELLLIIGISNKSHRKIHFPTTSEAGPCDRKLRALAQSNLQLHPSERPREEANLRPGENLSPRAGVTTI
jgi:hypothetical protein